MEAFPGSLAALVVLLRYMTGIGLDCLSFDVHFFGGASGGVGS
jgi:hypothetical protein